MTTKAASRYWLFALILGTVAVGLSIAFVDRPVATFLGAHVRHTELWVWIVRALRPLDLVVTAEVFLLCGCGIWALSGRQLRGWTERPLLGESY